MIPSVRLDAGEVFGVAAQMQQQSAEIVPRVMAVTVHYGAILQSRVKGRASGRPGPRRVTGDYVRGINRRSGIVRGNPQSLVGTNKVQGRRLEFGFDDTDSLGRDYDQPPYPHFGPALDDVADAYTTAIAGVAVVGPLLLPAPKALARASE